MSRLSPAQQAEMFKSKDKQPEKVKRQKNEDVQTTTLRWNLKDEEQAPTAEAFERHVEAQYPGEGREGRATYLRKLVHLATGYGDDDEAFGTVVRQAMEAADAVYDVTVVAPGVRELAAEAEEGEYDVQALEEHAAEQYASAIQHLSSMRETINAQMAAIIEHAPPDEDIVT